MTTDNVEVRGDSLLIKRYNGVNLVSQNSVDIPSDLQKGNLPNELAKWVRDSLSSGKETTGIRFYDVGPGIVKALRVTIEFEEGFLQLKLAPDRKNDYYLSPVSDTIQ